MNLLLILLPGIGLLPTWLLGKDPSVDLGKGEVPPQKVQVFHLLGKIQLECIAPSLPAEGVDLVHPKGVGWVKPTLGRIRRY